MNLRDGKGIEGGLLVIRLFLALVFGMAAVTGMAIIVDGSSLLWIAFVIVMILPLLRVTAELCIAARQSLRFLTARQPGTITPVTQIAAPTIQTPAEPAIPTPSAPATASSSSTPTETVPTQEPYYHPMTKPIRRESLEERLARVRHERRQWLARLRERQEKRS